MDTRQIAIWNEKERRFIWYNKEDLPPPSQRKRAPFFIHTDTIAPLTHPGDGKTYDSKSALRATTKRLGLVELGNDQPDIATYDEPIKVYENTLADVINTSGGWQADG